MIEIDGSAGEGGGQILRSTLGLSMATCQPFLITGIRANRKKPGLMRQHLTAVRAAAEIGSAVVEGAEIGSGKLVFRPGEIRPGSYHFSIGTAGSCTLVFQCILPALLVADGPSNLVLEGGTHNPKAPPFDFLEKTFLPLLHQMGAKVMATLDRPGFYPAGGGRLQITIEPAQALRPIELLSLANIGYSARAVCAQLPSHIGRRELRVVQDELHISDEKIEQVQLDTYGPGNVLTIFVHSDQLTETFTGFGRRNVSAEKVAAETIKQVRNYIQAGSPAGPYLADQLLIPIALAGSGCMRTSRPSSHTLTNIAVIKQFFDIDFQVSQKSDLSWEIRV
ncbi:MAG: RNA 3'-terminal-phosphate cyclase [Desulfobulbaceae bacterium BRH_c16a]|nr:MAG: RNA 3'-terminal-phosphate cyclase [Desulfobulbaceae bacterium BRH_c16a]